MDSEITTGQFELPADLPRITSIRMRRIRLAPPVSFYVLGERVTKTEAIELIVQASAAFPTAAITPALFIGDVPVSSYRAVGPGTYRFLAYDPETLAPGAPIAFGWPDVASARVTTPFVFDPGAFPVA